MKLTIAAIASSLALAGCVSDCGRGNAVLIAHRGESFDAPENTLPAYKTAVERGFGFECDIYLSSDKRLFTFHDTTLKRTTSGANTNACTVVDWDTVSKLNVGGWGKWKGSKFDPTRPALLEEVLALARPGRKIYVEVKGDNPSWVPYIKETFAKEPKATPETVLFISFGKKVSAELKKQMPEFTTYWLVGARRAQDVKALIATLRELGVDGVDMGYSSQIITEGYIAEVKKAGFEFHVWTIDDPKVAAEAFSRGAQTVTTNRAQYLLESLSGADAR